MRSKSRPGKVKRVSATELKPASAKDLAALRAAARGQIDTSEIAEGRPGRSNAKRRPISLGKPKPVSPVRESILAELKRREMTRYELWKNARRYSPTISESAVYEFLRGERQIGLTYAEALMNALDLTVVQRRRAAG